MSAKVTAEKSVAFVSLGCAKNLVDSEVMIAHLGMQGWKLIADADAADAVVVNTCAFIDPAKAESTDAILERAAHKRPGQRLVVAGCLSQRYGEQLRTLIPEIDGIVGTGAYAAIVEVLNEIDAGGAPTRLDFIEEPEHDFLPRLVTTQRATAYLKVAEGCDHPCTFCIIPQLRGAFRSRSTESILREAEALVAGGARELVLIAQDTSMYGRDRGARRGGLAQLLERLHPIEGLEWIRLLYLYPATLDSELIDAVARLPKVCKYLDMPLQHAHPEVLRMMRRPSNGERYLEILEDFRQRVPGITMRSTFIVGFPGERDEHVDYLAEWLERAELDRVGFFGYSQEEGTPAGTMDGQVPEREIRRRLIRLREVQRRVSERVRARRVGQTLRVLVEGDRSLRPADPLREALGVSRIRYGRSMGEAPGVDGIVAFAADAPVGSFVFVRLDGATSFDSYGTLTEMHVMGEAVA
ncbi:MAG TPA: 30S ribosomal protein S12 methylthiotransferase RimO [Candidatus Baltobacteraceae bacterium]|jgi:ribosomal protein S12 methylthiotransferase|nr:30S ribosomal protein S12 methylthiotransferase RimO [Candidatus Baltobacteraceae bacterium]